MFVAMERWHPRLLQEARRVAGDRPVHVVHVLELASPSMFDPLHDQLDKCARPLCFPRTAVLMRAGLRRTWSARVPWCCAGRWSKRLPAPRTAGWSA